MAAAQILPQMTVNGHEIRVAPLETINYQRLLAKDAEEVNKLVNSCKQPGFFYLDLNDDSTYLQSLDTLYGLARNFFAEPKEVKMADYRDLQDRGYKPGEAETFEISRDEVAQKLPAIPQAMSHRGEMVEGFINTSHGITMTILSLLAETFNMPHLLDYHLESRPSDSGLKLESVPFEAKLEDVPPSEHTDQGTLTLLFCAEYTTELRVPGTNDWAFIVPKPGHAIVNVADSLQRLTKQELLSCLHRVGQPTPVTGPKERFCVLYYLRPAADIAQTM